MAITRKLSNGHQFVDLTEEINEMDNQYGFIRSKNYFRTQGVSSTSITFDKSVKEKTLLPQVKRGSRGSTYGKDRDVTSYALPLAYFKHSDQITPEDIQGFRQPGGEVTKETLANVRMEKLEDMREEALLTDEYLQLQALKGVCKSPDGAVVADMFNEFGVAQLEKDLDLGTSSTQVATLIRQAKREVAKNIRSGARVSGYDAYLSPEMFDKLKEHPLVKEKYLYYAQANAQIYRENQQTYEAWGITDFFQFEGIMFYSYDAEFNMPDGTTERAFEEDEGLLVPSGVRNLFRGFHGPANKLSIANQVGQPMYVFEYTDPKDECHDLELEMSSLYMNSRPLTSYKLTSST